MPFFITILIIFIHKIYEIYIISDYDLNAAMNIVMEVDKNHVCNYLFSDAMKLRNGTRVKDISYFSCVAKFLKQPVFYAL